jgi:MFS family permease
MPCVSQARRRGSVGFSRPVWLLGWISLFTDTASEAIYPLLPLFLTRTLRAGPLSLGIVEGFAEAVSSLLKIVSGRLADRWRRRRPLVMAGYLLSSTVRPLISLVSAWPQLLALRLADRAGKGIRTAPRDAMLAQYAPAGGRGRVFGFHRAMDHAGAIAGPLLAAAFLLFYAEAYRSLFALTIIPGGIVALLVLRLPPDPTSAAPAAPPVATAAGTPQDWRRLPGGFYRVLAIILLFTLGNSSDAFLLLRLSDVGVPAAWVPLLWSLLHVVKAGSVLPGGALSDRWGRRRLIASGWLVYAGIYAGFAAASSLPAVVTLFLAYGLYFGLAEGAEKALVADYAPADLRGTAFGLYNAAVGVGTLAASVIFGLLWSTIGPAVAFGLGAVLALLATGLLVLRT